MLKAIISMAVAAVAFTLIMGKLLANPVVAQGLPARAGVYPLGFQTFLGGLPFGLGMVVAGGRACPAVLGGLLLGVLNVLEYPFQQPWGVTTEIALWSGWPARGIGLPAEGLWFRRQP